MKTILQVTKTNPDITKVHAFVDIQNLRNVLEVEHLFHIELALNNNPDLQKFGLRFNISIEE